MEVLKLANITIWARANARNLSLLEFLSLLTGRLSHWATKRLQCLQPNPGQGSGHPNPNSRRPLRTTDQQKIISISIWISISQSSSSLFLSFNFLFFFWNPAKSLTYCANLQWHKRNRVRAAPDQRQGSEGWSEEERRDNFQVPRSVRFDTTWNVSVTVV